MTVFKSTLTVFAAATVLGLSTQASAGSTLDAVMKKGFV